MEHETLDRIYIRDLQARCIVGIFPHERTDKQDVIINLCLYGRLGDACQSDSIEDTINYKSVKKKILAMVEGSDFQLIERLAQEIADICLEDARVAKVDVSVDKPGALRFARSVAVEITRVRKESP